MRRRQALRYPAHRVRQVALTALSRLGYRLRLATPHRAVVVVLSYRRMRNIPAIVRGALLCDFVDKVIVSNNNPDVCLGPTLPTDEPRLELVEQERRRRPSFRYELARDQRAPYYICIDDDVFPSPWQLRRLFAGLVEDPSAPRGTAGEVYDERRHELVPVRARRRTAAAVDVVLQTHTFTGAHLERYFELLAELGTENDEVLASEDVIISFTGRDRPVVDPVGPVYECPTADDPEIATYRQAGFQTARNDLYRTLQALC